MASSPEDNKETPYLISEEINVDHKSQAIEQENSAKLTATELERDLAVAAESVTDGKINLFLKATSDVPIMKKKKWQVDENKTIHWVITFIKKYLKLEEKDTIFLYVAQAFAPSPDQQIKNLYECFGSDNKLVLHYSKTPAWG